MELAAAMLDLAPERPTAWINSAQTLHELKQTQDAWNALYAVRERFPKVATIPYNLACYACKLGRIDDSRKWLRKAVALVAINSDVWPWPKRICSRFGNRSSRFEGS
jgi:predicted Zn-dependent protease